jgi:hypothetical protein
LRGPPSLACGTRLRPLPLLERDPIFMRFVRLRQLPCDRTVSRTLKETTAAVRERMSELLRGLAYDTARQAGLSRITLDLDGSVLRTGVRVEGAERGFNPHHPKDKSYYPLTAHLAQTSQLLAVANRPGNVHDSEGALEVLNVPAKIAKPEGRTELRLAAAPETQRRITQILAALPEAA